MLMRRLFRVKKAINAKAMALFAHGYLNLYEATENIDFKAKALYCLNWLIEHPSPGYRGLSWGYPFHWQSKVLIPRQTPSAVVSSAAGDAFSKAYEFFGSREYLDACDAISVFFTESLNIDRLPDGSVCFSYTPLDGFHVHNANLLVAQLLIRTGLRTGTLKYIELGRKAADYALGEQNGDGSLYYWGRCQNHYDPGHIDHYHTGFEIRSLYRIWKSTGEEKYYNAVEKYYRFYRKNLLVERDGLVAPRMTPHSFYPVNIHSCAEAILVNATLSPDFAEAAKALPLICEWVLSKMQTEEGWFRYMISHNGVSERNTDVPYIRWGQAWMMLALSRHLLTDSKGSGSSR